MSDSRLKATIAALDWVGMYEAEDPTAPDESYASITLEAAFGLVRIASSVKTAWPGFPEDMVDAYAMLRRMYESQLRARRNK